MLFVAPERRGRSIGRQLVRHAVDELGASTVDVNEQNPQALSFYQRMGFRATGRSPLDGQGKPFPLIHMTLAAAGTRGERAPREAKRSTEPKPPARPHAATTPAAPVRR